MFRSLHRGRAWLNLAMGIGRKKKGPHGIFSGCETETGRQAHPSVSKINHPNMNIDLIFVFEIFRMQNDKFTGISTGIII